MIAVLLQGYIDRKKTDQVLNQIESLFEHSNERKISLVIDSEGGKVAPSIVLIQSLHKYQREGMTITVQIQNAASMAAIIALSVGKNRLMSRSGMLEIHTGQLDQIEASDIDLATGTISESILTQFKQYQALLETVLTKYKLDQNNELMTELYGSNWLRLNAKTCAELQLVDEIF